MSINIQDRQESGNIVSPFRSPTPRQRQRRLCSKPSNAGGANSQSHHSNAAKSPIKTLSPVDTSSPDKFTTLAEFGVEDDEEVSADSDTVLVSVPLSVEAADDVSEDATVVALDAFSLKVAAGSVLEGLTARTAPCLQRPPAWSKSLTHKATRYR